jgi:isopentenyl-diphosphate delta-isomerase
MRTTRDPGRLQHERPAEDQPTPAALSPRQTTARKGDHIRICLEKDVSFSKKNGFERYDFEHRALPEIDLDEIDTTVSFLDRKFRLPFLIEPITGGTRAGHGINRNLAKAAEHLGIGIGLGSQRAMLEEPRLTSTYLVRDVAPSAFLLGNIGAAQLAGVSIPELEDMLGSIGADGLAIHLNACHEMVQPEGDTRWKHVIEHITNVCNNVSFPVVVKEVGCGISGVVARTLESAGATAIDVAGAGGTCFSRVEFYRGAVTAEPFFEWGIPTAEALAQCRETVRIPLIASGGIRSGLECAKALALGATLVGFALPVLGPASESHASVEQRINELARELRKTMLLVGAKDISQLKMAKIEMTR